MAFLMNWVFRTKPSLDEKDYSRASRGLLFDAVGSMSMVTLQGGPFLAAFAIALGASNYEVGLLATIGFVSQFMQLPGLMLVQRIPRRRGLVVLCAAASRLVWILIILIPLVFVGRGVTFLMQWLAVAAAAGALAGPAWNSLLRDVIPADRMGHMYSRRMTLGTVFALVFTLAGGYFVNFWQGRFPAQPLYAYCILFGLGLLFGLIGLAGIVSIPEPQMTSTAGVSIWELLSKPVKDRNFRGLLKYIAAWNFAINIAGPFFIVYLIERIQLDLGMVTVLVVVSQVTNLVFLRIWGRLADRFSNKSVLRVSSPLFLLAILAWTFTTMPDRHVLTLPVLFAIHILSGMAVAGISLASANIAMKLSPNGQAHAYMTAYGIAGAMAGAVAPMLGGMFADFFASRQLSIAIDWAGPGEGLRAYALNLKALDFLFGLAFVLGLIALRFLRKVDESGEADAKVVRDELLSQTFATVRTVSTLPGLRFLVAGPVSAVYKVASTLKNGVAGNGEASGESSDGASPPEEAGQP